MNDNRRIILNTGVIYIKLILSAIIGLYTSRLILQALGADDYGLYSVVGGIVTFLNVIGTTMVSVSYRFLAVEIGKGIDGNPNKIFNTVFVIHLAIAIILLIVGETAGLIYVDNYLNILPNKLDDARFVLHVSLVTTSLSVLSVPANGLIIAREKFVFTSIVETLSLLIKLVLVMLMGYYLGNKLRLFAIIMAIVTIFSLVSYQLYVHIKEHDVIKWKINRNKEDYKGIFSFAWWSLFGGVAYIGKEQGAAMIINHFFGTALNAAFGLATQINRCAMMFTKGLSQAAIPQIMKSYGSGNNNRSLSLVYGISRLSTFILLVIVIPLVLCMDGVLALWLKTPPEYTAIFSSFMMINALVAITGAGFDACIQSTGNVKENEIYSSIIYLSLLPIIYLLYSLGFPPYANVVVLPFLSMALRVMQVYLMKKMTDFSIALFWRNSLRPSIIVCLCGWIPLFYLRIFFDNSPLDTILLFSVSVTWMLLCVFLLGLKTEEKYKIIKLINNKIKR